MRQTTVLCGLSRSPISSLIHRPSTSFHHPSFPHETSSLICGCAANADSHGEEESGGRRQFKDTRIHWGSSEEGWVGISESPDEGAVPPSEDGEVTASWQNSPLMGILVDVVDSHYRYLELTPDAETEEIKAAYRRLSKLYHPDTTQLPVELAAAKFVRLKEAYSVLSSEEERRFYDWGLAQELSSQQSGRFMWPYEAGERVINDDPQPMEVSEVKSMNEYLDPVDRLGGRNMGLSDQAQTALAFDAFAVAVSILSIVYALFIKHT